MRYNILGCIGELDSLPGCGQIAISHGVFLPEWYRHRGTGKLANAARQKLAFKELGYDCMICTIDATNIAQIKVLIANKWERLYEFKSSKTGHTVQIWACSKEKLRTDKQKGYFI